MQLQNVGMYATLSQRLNHLSNAQLSECGTATPQGPFPSLRVSQTSLAGSTEVVVSSRSAGSPTTTRLAGTHEVQEAQSTVTHAQISTVSKVFNFTPSKVGFDHKAINL